MVSFPMRGSMFLQIVQEGKNVFLSNLPLYFCKTTPYFIQLFMLLCLMGDGLNYTMQCVWKRSYETIKTVGEEKVEGEKRIEG